MERLHRNPRDYKKASVPVFGERNALVIGSSARLRQTSARNSVNRGSSCQDSKEMSMVFAQRCQRGQLPAAGRHLQPQRRQADQTGQSAPRRPVTLHKKKSSYPALPGGSRALAIGLCAVSVLPPAAEDKHQVTTAVQGVPFREAHICYHPKDETQHREAEM